MSPQRAQFKMVPEVKARLIQALLDGSYQQAKRRLRVDDTFCCLGVICDLKDPSQWARQGDDFSGVQRWGPVYGVEEDLGGGISFLPKAVQEWCGLDRAGTLNTPIKVENGHGLTMFTLSSLNDAGWTFEQIAKVIEEQF